MNYLQREYFKKCIEQDLKLLIEESWNVNIITLLSEILNELENVQLEGYDD